MQPEKSKLGRRKYDDSFKQEVLKMAESGRCVADIARSLGVGQNLIYKWKIAQNRSGSVQHPSAVAASDEQNASLHKRIRELEQERDILKKALGIFSRPT